MTADTSSQKEIYILQLLELDRSVRAGLVTGIDRIFFEASGTKAFADDATRAAFRERWLGRYLTHDPQWFYVALAHTGEPLGYLAGCLDNPAVASRFADIGYFAILAPLTAQYPAHLHINLAPVARSLGIGSRLVERFAADAARTGVPGVHVVTGQGLRNVGFYRRNGFDREVPFAWQGRTLVFLGRTLVGSPDVRSGAPH